MRNRIKAAAMLCAVVLLLSGCSLLQFKSPEEFVQQEEYNKELSKINQYVDPKTVQLDDLVFSNQLKTNSGKLVAEYVGRCPSFSEEGVKGIVFERINEFYKTEFALFEEDCATFFEHIQKGYGQQWEALDEVAVVQSADFSYELLEADENHIGVLRHYAGINAAGQAVNYYYGELFLASTGWQLKFFDLFEVDVQAVLRQEIQAWCEASGVGSERLESAEIEDLVGEYTLDRDSLYLGVSPFVLSSEQTGGVLLKLPLISFSEYYTGK